jgi:hypothetical protein
MTTELVAVSGSKLMVTQGMPAIVATAGAGARFAWEEFFDAERPNRHTVIARLAAGHSQASAVS